MMKLLLPGLLLIACLAGCAGKSLEEKVVGGWKVDMTRTEMSGEKVKDEKDKAQMEELLKTVTINLKPDKTFTMEFLMSFKGTWALEGNKVILSPDAEGGTLTFAGGKKTMDFEADAEATSLTFTAETPEMKGKMVLVRSDAK